MDILILLTRILGEKNDLLATYLSICNFCCTLEIHLSISKISLCCLLTSSSKWLFKMCFTRSPRCVLAENRKML